MNHSLTWRRLVCTVTAPLVCLATLCVVPEGSSFAPRLAHAQEADESATPTDPAIATIESLVERGRAQLLAGDPNVLQTLQVAARKALESLRAASGDDPIASTLSPGAAMVPLNTSRGSAEKLSALRVVAAQAHFWWGRAEDTLGDRDRAITALARALSFAGGAVSNAAPSTQNERLARDATLRLNAILREGLPQVAPDDTLEIIAARAHGGLWQPRRSAVQLPP
jgi:hypothetical protein